MFVITNNNGQIDKRSKYISCTHIPDRVILVFIYTPRYLTSHRRVFCRFLFTRIVALLFTRYYCRPVFSRKVLSDIVSALSNSTVWSFRSNDFNSPPRTNMNKDDDVFEFNAPTTITRLCDMANTYDDGADQIFGKSFAT